MNASVIFSLKAIRKIYSKISSVEGASGLNFDNNPDSVSKNIFELLMDENPCMIARFGSTELTCLVNHLGVNYNKNKISHYIKGKSGPWWWESSILNQMQQWSGFFPPTIDKVEEFCELMLQDMEQVDVLGSWLSDEKLFEERLKRSYKARFIYLEPFWSKQPWTKALENKKVLVIHPFINTITKQYAKRELLFENNLLPSFELKTLRAVQSIAGTNTSYNDWFEALEYMKGEIDKIDFDVCLIGAGAYGFPLAAHVKRIGKKGFHFGGSLQLLFGIKGKRWENPDYGSSLNLNYSKLFNSHWIRAEKDEVPVNSNAVEDGCYW